MILYLDTSALVKLYVDEPMSQELTNVVNGTEAVATSLLAIVMWWKHSRRMRGSWPLIVPYGVMMRCIWHRPWFFVSRYPPSRF